jgi:CBS domain-containing protein
MALMTEHRIRHVPVVDDGILIGLVSIGDAVKVRMRELEYERDRLNDYVSGTQ